MEFPTWRYHKKYPNGCLFQNQEQVDASEKAMPGWVDTPAKLKVSRKKAAPAAGPSSPPPPGPPVTVASTPAPVETQQQPPVAAEEPVTTPPATSATPPDASKSLPAKGPMSKVAEDGSQNATLSQPPGPGARGPKAFDLKREILGMNKLTLFQFARENAGMDLPQEGTPEYDATTVKSVKDELFKKVDVSKAAAPEREYSPPPPPPPGLDTQKLPGVSQDAAKA